MDTLTSLRVFCTVADLRSFTRAAERLGLSSAMASKHVVHLETRLGTRLLNRTSRHVSLTEAGTLYFNQTRQMLDGLAEVEAAISDTAFAPSGKLRLSAPVWFANPLFAQMLSDYKALHPAVTFDVDLSGRLVNLVEEGFDLALRATATSELDPGLVARQIGIVPFQLVAAPDYLRRRGRPAGIPDLDGHDLLVYPGMSRDGSIEIRGSKGAVKIRGVEGAPVVKFDIVLESGNETMLHLATNAGLGMAFLPQFMIGADVENGRLEYVISDVVPFSIKLFAAYPSRRYLSAKVRTFIDFIASEFGRAVSPTSTRLHGTSADRKGGV